MKFTYTRKDWVKPGLEVSGPAFLWSNIDYIVIHYPGVADVPDEEFKVPYRPTVEELAQYMRNVQYFYLTDRDYSVGYNAAIDYMGSSWELRGETYKSAATRGLNHNSFAIKLVFDIGEPANGPAIHEVQNLVKQIRHRRPHTKIIPHRNAGLYTTNKTTATACPGDPIYHQVMTDVFEPPTLPPKDDDMISYAEIMSVTSAPPVADVQSGRADRWLNAALLRTALFDTTGSDEYDQQAANKLNTLLQRRD